MILTKAEVISDLTDSIQPDHLISPPSTTVPDPILRSDGNYTNLSERFKLRNKNFKRQYAPLYSARLSMMKPTLVDVAKLKWFDVPIVQLNDIEPGKVCVIIGTLFKEMQLKPNILRDLSEDINLPPKPGDYIEQFLNQVSTSLPPKPGEGKKYSQTSCTHKRSPKIIIVN